MSWASGESEDYLPPQVYVPPPKNKDWRGHHRADALNRTNSVDPRVNGDVISFGERIDSSVESPSVRRTSYRARAPPRGPLSGRPAPTGHFYNADSIEARLFFDANNEHIQSETGIPTTVQPLKDGYVGDQGRKGNFDQRRNQYHDSVHLHKDKQRAHVGVRSQGMEFGPLNQGDDFFARPNNSVLGSHAHQAEFPLNNRYTVGYQQGPPGSIPLHMRSNDPSSEQSHNDIINSRMNPTVFSAPLRRQDVAGILTEPQREAFNKGSEDAFQPLPSKGPLSGGGSREWGGKSKKRKSVKRKSVKRKSTKKKSCKPKRKSRKSRKPKRKSKKSNRKSRKSNKKSRKPKRKLFNK